MFHLLCFHFQHFHFPARLHIFPAGSSAVSVLLGFMEMLLHGAEMRPLFWQMISFGSNLISAPKPHVAIWDVADGK